MHSFHRSSCITAANSLQVASSDPEIKSSALLGFIVPKLLPVADDSTVMTGTEAWNLLKRKQMVEYYRNTARKETRMVNRHK